MEKQLIGIEVENFRSLRKVSLPLRPLNVLVGPNGAGKTNVLHVFQFLADLIGTDLQPALDLRGGFDEVAFWGGEKPPTHMQIKLLSTWTTHSSRLAPDEYLLRVSRLRRGLARRESFQFKRTQGRGRRITISGRKVNVVDTGRDGGEKEIGINALSSGLSTLPRLSDDRGGTEVSTLAERIASWHRLVDDARAVLPQVEDVRFDYLEGAAGGVVIHLHERGLRRPTQLADASYGTIRLLGLLALLYDPNPPALTCVEEIDHGLHPQALELLVERLREASERTQLLIATHSPALADRLAPEELIVCERRDDGSSMIPAVSAGRIEEIVAASEGLPLGELWFSGALGGDL